MIVSKKMKILPKEPTFPEPKDSKCCQDYIYYNL
jgi:hypothetical protein